MNFKINESADKLRGGYYTDPEIARFLLRWVGGNSPRRVLEPGCGDGVFFRQMAEVSGFDRAAIAAFETNPEEAQKARASARSARISAEVHSKDFLAWALRNIMSPSFDAVVGNPPFIRYQYLDPSIQTVAEKLFEVLRLPFTRHTNAWVSFALASLALLRSGGRLGMVVPAELLHVLHAESLRVFLGSQCSRVLIIDPEELWFSGALQGAVLLLAEKKQRSQDASKGVAVIRGKTVGLLRSSPEELFARADFANGETKSGKWMRAFLSASQRKLLDSVTSTSQVRRFGTIASTDVGIVTGANKFFLVTDQVVEEYGLQPWTVPMFGRSEHVPGVIYGRREHKANRKQGLPTNFLWFNGNGRKLPESVRRYLRQGEAEDLHLRYKCRIREPWYAVPSVYASPIGMLKRSHDYPRLIHNSMGALTTDTAYRIEIAESVSRHGIVFSFINSLTALSAELEGRHYGGGVLELVPSEIEKLLVPLVDASPSDLRQLDARIRNRPTASALLEENDRNVFKRAGLRLADADELRDMWSMLRRRRQRAEGGSEDQPISSVKTSLPGVGA